jgi:hypothetical protein
MNQIVKSKNSRPGSTEAVTFTDGMLVTAEDLNAAARYPLEVVQVLLRSYFGCGIVCGLGVKRHTNPNDDKARYFAVDIGRGVALDCQGYPIELCEEITLDFRPDPCGCPIDGEQVRYIAIRRFTAPEAPARGCGCGPAAGEPGQQCSRVRDHVLVQAFDEKHLPAGICMRPPADGDDREADEGICDCLTQCPDCDRCAEPWVLLATVMVDQGGVTKQGVNSAKGVGSHGGPQQVKPIACLCDREVGSRKRLKELEDRIKKLEGPPKDESSTGGATPTTGTSQPINPVINATLGGAAAAGAGSGGGGS